MGGFIEKDAELFIDARAALGEGPCWDSSSGCLYWVDILEKKVCQYSPVTEIVRSFSVRAYVGAVVPRVSGGLILALQNGIYSFDPDSGTCKEIANPEKEFPGNRFNDGKCDPTGRFWAGTMSMQNEEEAGALYSLDLDGRVRKVLSGVTCSNGIAWSPDEQVMYYIDTPTRKVAAFDFDVSTGQLGASRTVVTIPESEGYPDGMTIDSEGMIWVAQWDGYCVSRWDPKTGTRLLKVRVPTARVTSCAFGGDKLDELYITTAMVGLSDEDLQTQPNAGGIFRFKTDIRGTPSYPFRG